MQVIGLDLIVDFGEGGDRKVRGVLENLGDVARWQSRRGQGGRCAGSDDPIVVLAGF